MTEEIHLQEQVAEYEAKIASLERKVGQLAMELDVMKKRVLVPPRPPGVPRSIISGPGAFPSAEDAAS